MRNTNINLTSDDMIRIAENLGTNTAYSAVEQAIGYLATWNLSYPTCNIFRDGNTDLVAVYLNAGGQRQYVIGAVWHDTHYGFHS